MKKRILAIDFDGVIHSYTSGWRGLDVIPDGPVPGAMEAIAEYRRYFNVVIITSRFKEPNGFLAVGEWLQRYGLPMVQQKVVTDVTRFDWDQFPEGKIILSGVRPPAFVTIDDRGWTFAGTFPSVDELAAFKTWQQQEQAAPKEQA